MEMMSHYENMDIMLSENTSSSIERELENVIFASVGNDETETIP